MTSEDQLREECAVFGISLDGGEAAGITYNGLLSLQHRGQEGAGIAVVSDNQIRCRKDVGLVSEAFTKESIQTLPKGSLAVGHARYSTAGGNTAWDAGPFVTEYLTGRIVTAHNGNITNVAEIRERLMGYGLCFQATSDSEVVSSLLAYCITREGDSLSGIVKAADLLNGAFSLVVASNADELFAVRDTQGYRPLCLGRNERGMVAASESCALDATGFHFVRDVLPGEVVRIKGGRITHEGVRMLPKNEGRGLCIFEYVYFARPDSVLDGLSVYEARYRMGEVLAKEHPAEADLVCGVPDSGLEAASGYGAKSGVAVAPAFVKNRYIGRSFIYPTQMERDGAVRLKLNPLASGVRGKRIVLVDDSIVRGTTSERIVRSLKSAGAREVHMRISSPPFRHACHYGTDVDEEDKLIANQLDVEGIRRAIGADSLGYISLGGLKQACGKCELPLCTACFGEDFA